MKEKRTYVAETFVHDKKVTYRTNTVEIDEYILSLSKSTYVVVIIILVYIYIYIYIYVSSIDRTKNVEHVLLCTKKEKKTVLRRGGGGGGGGL